MSPRYARLRPEMSVDAAIAYLRRQAKERLETIYYVYVLDAAQHLLGVVTSENCSPRRAERPSPTSCTPTSFVADEEMDQEALGRLFANNRFLRSRSSMPKAG